MLLNAVLVRADSPVGMSPDARAIADSNQVSLTIIERWLPNADGRKIWPYILRAMILRCGGRRLSRMRSLASNYTKWNNIVSRPVGSRPPHADLGEHDPRLYIYEGITDVVCAPLLDTDEPSVYSIIQNTMNAVLSDDQARNYRILHLPVEHCPYKLAMLNSAVLADGSYAYYEYAWPCLINAIKEARHADTFAIAMRLWGYTVRHRWTVSLVDDAELPHESTKELAEHRAKLSGMFRFPPTISGIENTARLPAWLLVLLAMYHQTWHNANQRERLRDLKLLSTWADNFRALGSMGRGNEHPPAIDSLLWVFSLCDLYANRHSPTTNAPWYSGSSELSYVRIQSYAPGMRQAPLPATDIITAFELHSLMNSIERFKIKRTIY